MHLFTEFAGLIVLTLLLIMAVMVATAAHYGGGPNVVYMTARAIGLRPHRVLALMRFLRPIFRLTSPRALWPIVSGGSPGADLVNVLRQKLIDAKATLQNHRGMLNAILEQEAEAKARWNGLLKKQGQGSLAAAEKDELPKAEAAYEAFAERLAGQRKLIANTEKDILGLETELRAEEERLAAEDKKLRETPSGRIQVTEDVAEKRQRDPKRGFVDHKDYLSAVMKFGLTNGRIYDDRLKPLAAIKIVGDLGEGSGPRRPFAAAGSDEQGVYSDPHGGFLVPVGVAPGILQVEAEDDPLAGLLTDVPMTAPTVKFNARVDKNHSTSVSGGFTVTRTPETVEIASSRGKFEQVTLTANDEFGLAFATEQILADSPQSFVAIIQAGFRDEYVANAMKERIDGSGVGERQGFLKAGSKIPVAKETGQAADTIKKENIDKMEARCWRYNRAVWLANHNTRPQLKSLVQVVGTGGNAVPYFTSEGGREMLSGRPIFFSEFAKTLGDEGDLILIVPSEYLEGTYQSEQFAESIHVRFTTAERAFRFYRRNDGRCWWTAALTPKNGDTLSPVVTLAARA